MRNIVFPPGTVSIDANQNGHQTALSGAVSLLESSDSGILDPCMNVEWNEDFDLPAAMVTTTQWYGRQSSWVATNTNAASGFAAATSGGVSVGGMLLRTGLLANGCMTVTPMGGTSGAGFVSMLTNEIYIDVGLTVSVESNATDTFAFITGAGDTLSTTTAIANGFWVAIASDGGANRTFKVWTANNGVQTLVLTTDIVASINKHQVIFYKPFGSLTYTCTIDGVACGSFVSPIPPTGGVLFPLMEIQKSNGVTLNASVNVDWHKFRMRFQKGVRNPSLVNRRLKAGFSITTFQTGAFANTKDPAAPVIAAGVATLAPGWYYTYGPDPYLGSTYGGQTNTPSSGLLPPAGVDFVPMILDANHCNPAELKRVPQFAKSGVMAFNEPDNAAEANMTPAQALALWNMLEDLGVPLGSPPCTATGYNRGGWMDQFLAGLTPRGTSPRVDFMPMHMYNSNYTSPQIAAEAIINAVEVIYEKYGLPIWLTECGQYNGGTSAPTDVQAQAFTQFFMPALKSCPYIVRYAVHTLLPQLDNSGTDLHVVRQLMNSDGSLSLTGQAFQSLT